MTYLGDGPGGVPHPKLTDLKRTDFASENVQAGGSPIDMYAGYYTKEIIKQTGYKGLAGYETGNVVPLKPFGDAGNSTITDLVSYVNKLKDIEVFYLDANKVKDSKALQGLKTAVDGAKADASKANTLATDYFINTGEKLNFTDGSLSVDSAYAENELTVKENKRDVAKYKIFLLNKDALLGAFNKTSNGGDISSGVLIGNKFFVTRYPVAVFRGFEQVSTDKTKFLPVFTHPQFLSGTGYGDLKGSLYSGSASAYTDTLTTGDKGTAETKEAFVDLYTGTMYYKGEQIGNANAYMSTGTADLESSVVVRPSTAVYKVNDNPNCITTVAQTDGFKPIESLQIGSETGVNKAITLPAKDPASSSNIMPVVFLMDYLELVYSPNTVGTDAFTAYGRKVRLDEKSILGNAVLSANTGTLAYIVGDGATQTLWGSGKTGYNPLTMTDFVDIDGFYDQALTPKKKDTNGEANNVSSAVHFVTAGTDSFETPGMIRSGDAASERCDTLPQIAAGSGVECTMMFGNTNLDSADSSATPKTPLFGITLYGGLYERGLFSDWINASGNANLTKWAKTVSDLGYKNYAISNAVLAEKMKGNYAFELNKDGLLNLDLNTIVQINKDNTEARRGGGVMYLRTVLLILGFMLITYVSVLLAAWALDVNLDLGLNLLEKVSFNHFVAVRSLDEMPAPDPDSMTTYVDFRRLIIRCLAFAAVGVILTAVDPVNLIIKILSALNFILKVISQKIFGVNIM
ncbi:hypothetical protein [Clostridium beijerinckii]|nr:hypothetical protein [Clostridium beijerinckii]MBC2457162.1 hypothetical protein [Clostridium beijerinckii]NOV58683.1 hypothetical protein [Clostridium beijerinckii]NOV71932.1 hypothetical protein [Clostridium beijerinckii]NOW32038.1 hypothetical protein [Clostridium beijerinckii]